MGAAMMEGWIRCGVMPANITVVDPHADIDKMHALGVKLHIDPRREVSGSFDYCIFAVKPQNFDAVVASYSSLPGKCVYISIAAGKTIATMESLLGAAAPVVRAMPNLPATIGKGITALKFNARVNEDQQKHVEELMECVGDVIVLDDESKMDAVTAISGSGPAYIFHFIESLAAVAEQMGFSKKVALQLAKSTVYGSAKLAVESEKTPEQLRIDVTSPAGTTEAALKVLMGDKKLENLLANAIKAAEQRSKELK